MSSSWSCTACTFVNAPTSTSCEICLTDRAAGSAGTNPPTSNDTQVSLQQTWASQGDDRREVVAFSQKSRASYPTFSNYHAHAPVQFDVPSFSGGDALVNSGRPRRITFTFSEKAVMACKAALFGDMRSFDAILRSTDSREAKGLGRGVRPWNQATWDRMICPIAREVAIAKMNALPALKQALLQTGDAWIAEASNDWVWGIGLEMRSRAVSFPGRWRGSNVLGWALMEARDVARGHPPSTWLHGRTGNDSDDDEEEKKATSSMQDSDDDSETEDEKESSSKRQKCDKDSDPNGVNYQASRLEFGHEAFGPLERADPTHHHGTNLGRQVERIVLATYPEAKSMRGERGNKTVTRMLSDIYQQGLFMHGGPDSTVNRQVVPAFRHVIEEMNKLPPSHEKRVATIKALVEACQDCQQVQARVILRLYSDFTAQTETFEKQLKYSLVRQKEAALQVLITTSHPNCDLDHTQVEPSQQRDHLISGYTCLLGERLGLDGISTAKGDRFLAQTLAIIGSTHRIQIDIARSRVVDQAAESRLLSMLTSSMSVKEWISALIADINNQMDGAERLIDRACIFNWAATNMEGEFKHNIFYDDSREAEFQDLNPNKPTDDNQYEPFLSPRVLVEMLLKAGMVKRKGGAS